MPIPFHAPYQGSLLDAEDAFSLGDLDAAARIPLADGAWIDLLPGWVHGADALFERLTRVVPWRSERRPMYDRLLPVPRLVSFYGKEQRLPDPALRQIMRTLSARYQPELGESLCTAGFCLYRDGADSVAWHGDTAGRRVSHTIVAIVSFGTPRALSLRPRGGGTALRYPVGHGDLLVMGGTCQRTWEHAVLKTARPVGPRISVQFRPEGIR